MSRCFVSLALTLCLGAAVVDATFLPPLPVAVPDVVAVLSTIGEITLGNIRNIFFNTLGLSCPVNPAPKIQIVHFLCFFDRVNNNSNKLFEYDDYNKTAGRLMSIANYQRYTPSEMYGTPLKQGIVGKAFSVFPIVPLDVLLYVAAAEVLSKATPVLVERVQDLADVMFEAFNYKTPADHCLDKDELAALWFTFRQEDTSHLDEGHAALDLDGNGCISKPEFVVGGVCFFSTTIDHDRCGWFIGPDCTDEIIPRYLGTDLTSFIDLLQCPK